MTSSLIHFYCVPYKLLEKTDPHDKLKPRSFFRHTRDREIGFALFDRRPLFTMLRRCRCSAVAFVFCLPASAGCRRTRSGAHNPCLREEQDAQRVRVLPSALLGIRFSWNVSTCRGCTEGLGPAGSAGSAYNRRSRRRAPVLKRSGSVGRSGPFIQRMDLSNMDEEATVQRRIRALNEVTEFSQRCCCVRA